MNAGSCQQALEQLLELSQFCIGVEVLALLQARTIYTWHQGGCVCCASCGPWTLRRPNQAATRNSCHNNKFQNILESSYLQNTFEYLQTTLELCIFAILDFERSVALTERCQTSHLVNLCLDKHLLGLPQSTAIKYLAEQHLFGIACCLEDSLQSPLGSFIFPVGQSLANSHEVSTGDCNAKACSQKKGTK